jgi:hypothetical protein
MLKTSHRNHYNLTVFGNEGRNSRPQQAILRVSDRRNGNQELLAVIRGFLIGVSLYCRRPTSVEETDKDAESH